MKELFERIGLSDQVKELLTRAKSVTVAKTVDDLIELALLGEVNGTKEVMYDIPGKGKIVEATVCRVKNGVSVNYTEPYMRRRDPNSMLIGDDLPTDKKRYSEARGQDFSVLQKETLDWLAGQDLAVLVFKAGQLEIDLYGLAIAPINAGFFALGLGLLQGIVDYRKIEGQKKAKTVIYTAPPFRHTHFDGKQIVVHKRVADVHEIYSYNLYPGPSAKKGVYSALIDIGEKEKWITCHASVVQVVTPYNNKVNIMHEGASGGGKSEMHEHIHRELDGTIKFGVNTRTNDVISLALAKGCDLKPVTDDMALCHPMIQKGDGTLTVADAENGWFIRVDHIKNYGTDPDIEALSIHPKKPLLFFNIDAAPNSSALLWEHTEDSPGKPCPNPRFVVNRGDVPNIINKPVSIHVRSFGVRTPPCTLEKPSYGIIGLFHILPPALAWLWRLVSPRGFANPSIMDTEGMSSEGVGSYWPFSTGRMVDQANLLLDQIVKSYKTKYILCPNQHIGAWKVSFNPQWIMREYLARRGGVHFGVNEVSESRSPLLGYSLNHLVIEGQEVEKYLLKVELQSDVGTASYDQGAKILRDFFNKELEKFASHPELSPLGKKIIENSLAGCDIKTYESLIAGDSIFHDDDM